MEVKMAVVNKRTHVKTDNDVYIGRGSIWGNPYIIGRDGDRESVIAKYVILMSKRFNEDHWLWYNRLKELKGKNLVCYCKPKACHGDVLEELMEALK
jgi:hypothetical protein